MIIPDINLLCFAYNLDAPYHEEAREWWQRSLSGRASVGIPWVVVLGFLRIMTGRVVLTDPMTPAETLDHVRGWLERPQAHVLVPGPRHLEILDGCLRAAGTGGRLTTDAHLAALAIESQAELHSNDADFSRFPGLRWVNPVG